MNNSNASSNSISTRATLKLKTGAAKTPKKGTITATPQTQNNGKQKPGAHWSDEYKQRMQADMDALVRAEFG